MDRRQDDPKDVLSQSVPTSIDLAEATAIPTSIDSAEATAVPTSIDSVQGIPPGGNFSTLEGAGRLRELNTSTTGCYAGNGSLPILLAETDSCNLGFFCPNSTDNAPPQ
jgi:hypothetical protein